MGWLIVFAAFLGIMDVFQGSGADLTDRDWAQLGVSLIAGLAGLIVALKYQE